MEKVGSDDADARFGPHLAGEFDFTLLFEQSILSILPSSLFIIAAAYRVATLYRKGIQVRAGHSLWLKLVTYSSLFVSPKAQDSNAGKPLGLLSSLDSRSSRHSHSVVDHHGSCP
jgi:hypothetical protein